MNAKILIGGQALRNLGSSRHTDDVDYLINDTTSKVAFMHDTENNVDYLNANGNKLFAEIYKIEAGNEQASAQSLFELKAYAFVQLCQIAKFAKADAAEFDLKFLVRNFKCSPKLVKKYISAGELSEIVKIVNSVRF